MVRKVDYRISMDTLGHCSSTSVISQKAACIKRERGKRAQPNYVFLQIKCCDNSGTETYTVSVLH